MACGKEIGFTQCKDCGHIQITAARLCRDRMCPVCNWRLSIKRYGIMQNVMQTLFAAYPEYAYSLVTLTCENCKGYALSDTIDRMQKAWKTLISQRWAKRDIAGWGRSIEVTYNETAHTHHPHYHVIVVSYNPSTCDKVVQEWLRLAAKNGLKVNQNAQKAAEIRTHTEGQSLAGAICETYKYSIKATDSLTMPLGELRNLALSMANRRLVSFGGLIKEYLKKLQINDNIDAEEEEEEEVIEVCTKCKSQELDHLTAAWVSNRYFVVPSDMSEGVCNPEVKDACDEINEQIQKEYLVG